MQNPISIEKDSESLQIKSKCQTKGSDIPSESSENSEDDQEDNLVIDTEPDSSVNLESENTLLIGESLVISRVKVPATRDTSKKENIVSLHKIYYGCSLIRNHSLTCGCSTPRLHVYILTGHQCQPSCKSNHITEEHMLPRVMTLESFQVSNSKISKNSVKGKHKGKVEKRKWCIHEDSSTATRVSPSEPRKVKTNTFQHTNKDFICSKIKRNIKKSTLKIRNSLFRNKKLPFERTNSKRTKNIKVEKSCLEKFANETEGAAVILASSSTVFSEIKCLPQIFKPNKIETENLKVINLSSMELAIPLKKRKPLFQINKTGTSHSFDQFLKISSVSSVPVSSEVTNQNAMEPKLEINELSCERASTFTILVPIQKNVQSNFQIQPEIKSEIISPQELPALSDSQENDDSVDIKLEPGVKIKSEEANDDDCETSSYFEDKIEHIEIKSEELSNDALTILSEDNNYSLDNSLPREQLSFEGKINANVEAMETENFPQLEKLVTCRLCMLSFSNFASLLGHLLQHQKDGLILCYYCQKCFGDKTTMKRHMRTHTGEKPYQCKICYKRFSLPGNFKKHRDIHEDVRTEPCDICGKMFRRKEHLKQHKLTHTGEKPFKCSLCNSCFTARYSLQIHMNIHLGRRPFKCSYCSKAFSDKSTMTKHIRVHTGEKPFSCKVCEKTFGESGTLSAHATTHSHERPYQCAQCALSFKTSKGLRQHLKIHYGDKQFSCKYCGMMFIQKYNMLMHERIHTGEKPYECSECSRTFRSRSCLGKHVVLHGGELDKKYSCDYCEKKFHRKAHLKRHISTHLGIKEHACDICFKKFSIKSSLNKHLQTFHSEGARSFPCLNCGRTFKRSIYVATHKCAVPLVKEELNI